MSRPGRSAREQALRATTLAALTAVVVVLVVFVFLDWRARMVSARDDARHQMDWVADTVSATTDINRVLVSLYRTPAGAQGNLALHFADGHKLGVSHASAGQVDSARISGNVAEYRAEGGTVLLEQAVGPGGGVVVEAYLPDLVLVRSFVEHTLLATIGAAVGIGCAIMAGLWVWHPLITSLRAVVAGISQLGEGKHRIVLPPNSIDEVAALVENLDDSSRRYEELLASERELAADLSHRLRTPLAALRLDSESIGSGPAADRVRVSIHALETEIDKIIRDAQREPQVVSTTETSDLVSVAQDRFVFWSTLAEHQRRPCEVICEATEALVELPEEEAKAVIDALVGNVFHHTPFGTPFTVWVVSSAGWVTVVVEDGGPGIIDSAAAMRRGGSGGGSTGLGLDIARHAVTEVGGSMHIDRGRLGGARVRLRLGEAGTDHPAAPRAWRLWARSR